MQNIARISYRVALGAILLLITWCIAALVVNVFDLSVFEEKTSDFLMMAILPILATVVGAGIINVISNIGLISNHITNGKNVEKVNEGKNYLRIFTLVNVGVILLLVVGNSISSKIKEVKLIREIDSIIESNAILIESISNPMLTPEYLNKVSSVLKYIGKSNSKLNDPVLIFQCDIIGQKTLCSIDDDADVSNGLINKILNVDNNIEQANNKFDSLKYVYRDEEEIKQKIIEHISGSIEKPFVENKNKSNYFIYKLVKIGNTNCILRMNKYVRYGKIGS